MIEVNKKQDCCGCTACAAICPKDAIIMKEDKVKAEHCIRLTCYKLGIYSVAKKLYVRLTHKY